MIFFFLFSEVEKEKENTVWLEQSIMTKQGYNLYLCVLFWKPPASFARFKWTNKQGQIQDFCKGGSYV